MKPKYKSKKALQYTQAIAKMIEFEVPSEIRNIRISKEPEELLVFTIGILTDYVHELTKTEPDVEKLNDQENDLLFCAHYFDAYQNTERFKTSNDFLLLIGAITYYLSNQPGNAYVLLNKIDVQTLDLKSSYLDKIIVSILLDKPIFIDFSQDSKFTFLEKQLMKAYSNFYTTGSDIEKIFTSCIQLENLTFSIGFDDEILLAKYLHGILIKKIQNSCWINLPVFTNLPQDVWKPIITKTSFIKELWPSQLYLGREGIFQGKSAVIQMPTSSGKTRSTEIIIRSSFMAKRTNVAVVIAPFRALCNEIKLDYLKAFYGEKDIEVNSINDAFDEEDTNCFQDQKKKHIIVLTPEKFYYLLAHNKDLAEQVKVIIYDEGHQFDTGRRGVTYELLLTELNNFLPQDCQKILISAVIHNASDISKWLLNEDRVIRGMNISPTIKNIGFVTDSYQIDFVDSTNPDNIEYFVPRTIIPRLNQDNSIFPRINKPNEIASYYALKLCHKNMIAIYIHRKDYLSSLLKSIIKWIDETNFIKPAVNCNQEELSKILFLVEKNEGQISDLYKAVSYGLFPHHTNIPEGLRNSIEFAAHESLINFLLCTSTLAQGVNLPIKYLFVTTNKQGEGYFKIREFQNFIGRVGRAGKLTEGSIVFTDTSLKKNRNVWYYIKRLLNSDNSENCESSLAEIFEPFVDANNKKTLWNFKDIKILVDFYYDENHSARDFANYFSQKHEGFNEDLLTIQIEKKFQYIEQVENFLMILNEELSQELITHLAESTYAYYLANNDEQKEQVKQLFILIGNKFIEKEIETEKLNKYSKTLHGLDFSITLENMINDKLDNLQKCKDTTELFNLLWPIIDNYIDNKYYTFISDRTKVQIAVLEWIEGNSYKDILEILKNEKVSSNRRINMEYCVDIFEGGLSYCGSILLSAIKELIPEDIITDELDSLLLLLQKQIKYGLPNITSINLYELGFCDRVIAQEIASLCGNEKDKIIIEQQLCFHEEEITNLLMKYPSYFTNVLNRIINKYK